MEPFEIRKIQKEDNPIIAKVIRTVFEVDNYPKTGTAYQDSQLDTMFEAYSKPNSAYFVLLQNNEIVGGAGIAPLEHAEKSICELQKMYFLPTARGNGYGNKMLQICLKAAKELGFTTCYLETLPEMKTAQWLYQKYGFQHISNPMGNTSHSTCSVWMTKDLLTE